jgi:hypothetical protein
MQARYSKFLNSRPKVYGVEILDIYLIFLVWIFCSLLKLNDIVKVLSPFLVGVVTLYYKKNYRPHYLLFIMKKRKYTKIIVGVKYEK